MFQPPLLHFYALCRDFSYFTPVSLLLYIYILRYERVRLKRANGFPCVFHGSSVSIVPITVSTADSPDK